MDISTEFLEEAKKLGGTKTRTQVVILALGDFVQRRKLRDLLELKGTMDEAYDYKKLRKKR